MYLRRHILNGLRKRLLPTFPKMQTFSFGHASKVTSLSGSRGVLRKLISETSDGLFTNGVIPFCTKFAFLRFFFSPLDDDVDDMRVCPTPSTHDRRLVKIFRADDSRPGTSAGGTGGKADRVRAGNFSHSCSYSQPDHPPSFSAILPPSFSSPLAERFI